LTFSRLHVVISQKIELFIITAVRISNPTIVIIFVQYYGGETESTWYCGHCLGCCTSPRWYVMMIVEQSVEFELAEETEVLGGNLPQCHFAHHRFHMT
jgi:hypothetical protein